MANRTNSRGEIVERPASDIVAVVLLATLLGSASCGGAPSASSVITRDSAGVRIVENNRPALDVDELVVEAKPVLRLGTADGDESAQLFRVQDATSLPDGRVVIANAGSYDLKIYGASGELLRTVGRAGDGPGEFRHPQWVHLWRDTLVVFDPFQEQGRLSYFSMDGELLSSHGVSVPGLPYASPRALLPDGTLLDERGEASIGPTEVGYVHWMRRPIRYARDGSVVDTLARQPGTEMYREEFNGGMAQTDIPFGRQAMTAVGPDRIYLGHGHGFAIEAFAFDGRHLASIRAPVRGVRVTGDLVQRWIEARVVELENWFARRPEMRAVMLRRWDAPPDPEFMPEYSALQADANGRLWVQRYQPPWERGNTWSVFDADGRWLSDVALPLGLRPLEIGSDYMLGLVRDEMDVEYVQLHRIRTADK